MLGSRVSLDGLAEWIVDYQQRPAPWGYFDMRFGSFTSISARGFAFTLQGSSLGGDYRIRVQLPGSSTRRCASAASSMSSPRPGAVGRWKRPSTGRGGFQKTACMLCDGWWD